MLFSILKEILVSFLLTLVYADEWTKRLFQEANLEGKNFFEYMCLFSKVKLAEIYGQEFFDFKAIDKNDRVFDYTININCFREKVIKQRYQCMDEGMDSYAIAFGLVKTLISQATHMILDEGKANFKFIILLKTKFAQIRENYDDLLHREI
jgi:hypothetical protein